MFNGKNEVQLFILEPMLIQKFSEIKELDLSEERIRFQVLDKSCLKSYVAFIERNKDRFRIPFPVTVSQVLNYPGAKAWMSERMLFAKQKRAYSIVGKRFNSELVVCCSVFQIDWRVPKCEISWMTDFGYLRKGLATHLILSVINILRDRAGMKKILVRIDPDNLQSIKLAEKCGFQFEARIKNDFRDGNNKLLDVNYYSIHF